MRRIAPALAVVTALAVSACTQFPAIEDRVGAEVRDAPYQDLVPVERLRASVPAARIGDKDAVGVQDRADRLRARASRLGGAVVDQGTRTRMSQGVQ